MDLNAQIEFWYEMGNACATFKEFEQMAECDDRHYELVDIKETLKEQRLIERIVPTKLYHVHWDNGRYNLLRGVKEYEAFMLKRRRARTNPIKFTTVAELQVGEHYSCDGCQEYVTYPHKCMGFLDYM